MRRLDSTMSRRASFRGLAALAALPFTYGCNRTQEPKKTNRPDPFVVARELASRKALNERIRLAHTLQDEEFIKQLNNIDVNQESKTEFYKEIESFADKVLDYNTSVLRGYHYNALPNFFITFEKFAIENIEGFKPKYDPLYSKPQDQRERDHNESLKLSQLVIDVRKHCESLSKIRQR